MCLWRSCISWDFSTQLIILLFEQKSGVESDQKKALRLIWIMQQSSWGAPLSCCWDSNSMISLRKSDSSLLSPLDCRCRWHSFSLSFNGIWKVKKRAATMTTTVSTRNYLLFNLWECRSRWDDIECIPQLAERWTVEIESLHTSVILEWGKDGILSLDIAARGGDFFMAQ